MALKYTITERKMLTKDGTHARKQVATQMNLGKVTIHQLAREIADITSLGRGDVESVLTHLSEIAIRYATMGYSVKLGDLGTLTPRLSARALPVGEKYGAENIRKVNVRYTPSLEMKEQLRAVTFEKWDPTKDAKCPDPSVHTTPKDPEPGKETGGSEIN